MDDKDIEYAVKTYQKKVKAGNYSYVEFVCDIREHLSRRPFPYNSYDPFSLMSQTSNLWNLLEMNMRELVEYSKLNMAKFSRRFCIPYRTLQAWCDGTNPCPIYVKMMLGEILKVHTRTIPVISSIFTLFEIPHRYKKCAYLRGIFSFLALWSFWVISGYFGCVR